MSESINRPALPGQEGVSDGRPTDLDIQSDDIITACVHSMCTADCISSHLPFLEVSTLVRNEKDGVTMQLGRRLRICLSN
jgi:hypothetical protein